MSRARTARAGGCWAIAFIASFFCAAAMPRMATAEQIACRVYGIDPIHSSLHRRERIFVSTASSDPDDAVALGYSVASARIMATGLDFVIVFVTRLRDGMDTRDHTAGTTLAVVRFNPGMTSVIPGKLEATVVSKVILEPGEMAMLLAPRHDLNGVEVMDLWLTARETGTRFSCSD